MKISTRDIVASVLVLAILVPFIGYSINGSMPFVEDPRGMAAVGLVGGLLTFLAFGRKAFGTGVFEWLAGGIAVAGLGFAVAALVAETSWVLLVPMIVGIVVAWALLVAHDAGYLAPRRAHS